MFKNLIFLTLLLLFSFNSSSKLKTATSSKLRQVVASEISTSAFCFLNNEGTVYNLNSLRASNDYMINGTDYTVDFNVCQDAKTSCNGKTGIVSWFNNTNVTDCVTIAGSQNVVSSWTLLSNPADNSTAIQLKLPSGEQCRSDKTKNYTTYFTVACDSKLNSTVLSQNTIDINNCNNLIEVRSPYGCPQMNFYSFWNMIIANKYIIGVLVACAGIFFCFFGKRFVEITEILTGVLATFFVLVFLLFSYLQVTYTSAEFWVILVLSLLVGLAIGYFISKIEKVPVVLLGGFLGYITANFSYQFMLKYINSNPAVVYWLTVFTSVALFGIVAYFFYENVMIIATAFIGGYAIIRGISFMAGGFPEEKQIIDLIQNSEYDQLKTMLNGVVYAYLVSFIIISLAGCVIQFKYFNNKDEKDEKKENKKAEEETTIDIETKKPLMSKN